MIDRNANGKMNKILILLLCILILLCGCQQNNGNKNVRESIGENYEEINLSLDPILSYETFNDDYVIYMTSSGELVKICANSNQRKLLCNIPDFYLSMKHKVLDYPYIYFFAASVKEDTDNITNVLFRFNIESSQIDRFENEDGSEPGIPTYLFNGRILTLKNIVTDESTTTFIEAVNVEKNEWEKVLECSLDNKTYKGDAVFAVCANEKNVFALCDKRNGANEIETYLIILNDRFETVSSIKVDSAIHDYVMTSFITDIQAFGDYIYIINASNYGFLGKIENGQFSEVFKGRNFTMAINQSIDMPIFYTRRSNSVYMINDSGKLQEQKIPIENGYSIMFMMTNEESCFAVCYADDKDEHGYIFAKKDIGDIILPCK